MYTLFARLALGWKADAGLVQLLSTAYLLGATPETLHDLYEAVSHQLESWSESPDGMTTADWYTFSGRTEYQRAFVDFFEDEVVRKGYDWKHVVEGYLCEGTGESRGPLVDCLVAGGMYSPFW